MALGRLSHLRDIKITQAQGKVSYSYLNPLLQVEFRTDDFRTIQFDFSYILLNGSIRMAQCDIVMYVDHKQRLGCLCF